MGEYQGPERRSDPDREDRRNLFDGARLTFVRAQETIDELDGDPIHIQTQRIIDANRMSDRRDAHRARTEKAAAARRGATKADREKVRADVDALLAKYDGMSRTEACERVAPRYGISPSTALRYTRD